MTTNYQRHFGNPLRAAETLAKEGTCYGALTGGILCGDDCSPCPMHGDGGEHPCLCYEEEAWLGWLEREEAQ